MNDNDGRRGVLDTLRHSTARQGGPSVPASNEELEAALARAVSLGQDKGSGGVSILVLDREDVALVAGAIRALAVGAPAVGPAGAGGLVITAPGQAQQVANPTLPISRANQLNTNNADEYQVVVEWLIGETSLGDLIEVTMVIADPVSTLMQLRIGGDVQWTDRLFQAPSGAFAVLTVSWTRENRLAPNTAVQLFAKTINSAITVTVDGEISGTETVVG